MHILDANSSIDSGFLKVFWASDYNYLQSSAN